MLHWIRPKRFTDRKYEKPKLIKRMKEPRTGLWLILITETNKVELHLSWNNDVKMMLTCETKGSKGKEYGSNPRNGARVGKGTLLNYTWADCVPISSPNKSRQQQTERFRHWHILRDLSYLEHDASKIIRKLRAHTPKGSQGRLEIN